MAPDFTKYDGTSREPRPGQVQYLEHLRDNWNKADIHAGVLPVGAGKSLISRAIQLGTGADVITVSNALVAQYARDYPNVNFLKGKSHYLCRSGISCKEWKDCGFDPCPDCPYVAAKTAAAKGYATFYNPMSYYYHLIQGNRGNDTVVVDEAHNIGPMMLMLAGKRLRKSDYAFSEKCINEIYFIRWARDQIRRLDSLASMYYNRKELEKLAKCKQEIESLGILCAGIEEDPQNYVFWIDKDRKDTYLNVKPVFPPKFLMDRLFAHKKVILMSGTLFDYDIQEIAGDRSTLKYEMASPIPKENRQIIYKPAPFKLNYQTDPKRFAAFILSHLEPGKNALIHTTYGWAKKLVEFFPSQTICNTQEDKEEKIEEFKQKGGIFLASGCAEGLDFKGEICRLNIVSKINFPDLKDPVVQKRKAMQDGERWYAAESMRILIQQAGRSTRGPEDHSKIIVCDPNFRRMVKQTESLLPQYFKESLPWKTTT